MQFGVQSFLRGEYLKAGQGGRGEEVETDDAIQKVFRFLRRQGAGEIHDQPLGEFHCLSFGIGDDEPAHARLQKEPKHEDEQIRLSRTARPPKTCMAGQALARHAHGPVTVQGCAEYDAAVVATLELGSQTSLEILCALPFSGEKISHRWKGRGSIRAETPGAK